jgi:hypothetical protein
MSLFDLPLIPPEAHGDTPDERWARVREQMDKQLADPLTHQLPEPPYYLPPPLIPGKARKR